MAAASSIQPPSVHAIKQDNSPFPDSDSPESRHDEDAPSEGTSLRDLPVLDPEEIEKRLEKTNRELSNRRKILIKNLPQDTTNQEVHDILKEYELKYCFVDRNKGTGNCPSYITTALPPIYQRILGKMDACLSDACSQPFLVVVRHPKRHTFPMQAIQTCSVSASQPLAPGVLPRSPKSDRGSIVGHGIVSVAAPMHYQATRMMHCFLSARLSALNKLEPLPLTLEKHLGKTLGLGLFNYHLASDGPQLTQPAMYGLTVALPKAPHYKCRPVLRREIHDGIPKSLYEESLCCAVLSSSLGLYEESLCCPVLFSESESL
ncbi:uncharacterized protein LOC116222121 [Clupea harengus]|uniref:Uncharacterized protein LOC116222121 n=1 Tax=Clupea harengus TaxID=7950 RepID=A0A6P8FS38_CLUHA|nr:uncharacterized protein LOC116222121 [Clupea harengus]